MYKKILVPLDGSKVAETVLPYARELADNLQSNVELLGVAEPVLAGIHDYVYKKHHVSVDEAIKKQTEGYLNQTATYFKGLPGTVTAQVVSGYPADQIIAEAKKEPSTLIAMSTHGRSGVGRWALGSVADKVLHSLGTPILLVRGKEEKPAQASAKFKNLLMPLDGSATAEEASAAVMNLAKALKLSVTLTRVTPSVASYYQFSEYPTIDVGNLAQEVDADAQRYLDNTAKKFKAWGVSQVSTSLLHGGAADAIIDTAKKLPDSLIVMTTHGHSGVKRTLLGSVADRVVSQSERPVLVVTAK